jgi:hypothetical protein
LDVLWFWSIPNGSKPYLGYFKIAVLTQDN